MKGHRREYLFLCDELIQARNEARLSQVQVAAALKKPQSFVSKYETGERRLDLIELIKVIRILGIAPSKFMKRIERIVEK